MYKMLKIAILPIALFGMHGCNAKDPSQPTPPIPQASGVIPQAQLDGLNKAKNVENVLQQEQDAHQRSEQADQ